MSETVIIIPPRQEPVRLPGSVEHVTTWAPLGRGGSMRACRVRGCPVHTTPLEVCAECGGRTERLG